MVEPGWTDAGHGWQGKPSSLRLVGWSRQRRVILLRRPIERTVAMVTGDGRSMHPLVSERREAVAELCRRHGVRRLDAFGSAVRAGNFDPSRSDVDFLVEFGAAADDLATKQWVQYVIRSTRSKYGQNYADEGHEGERRSEAEAPPPVRGHGARQAVEASRNPIRRRRILSEAEPLYAA